MMQNKFNSLSEQSISPKPAAILIAKSIFDNSFYVDMVKTFINGIKMEK